MTKFLNWVLHIWVDPNPTNPIHVNQLGGLNGLTPKLTHLNACQVCLTPDQSVYIVGQVMWVVGSDFATPRLSIYETVSVVFPMHVDYKLGKYNPQACDLGNPTMNHGQA